jgi:CO/xanthine dehydrogenase FAD-binding subunit
LPGRGAAVADHVLGRRYALNRADRYFRRRPECHALLRRARPLSPALVRRKILTDLRAESAPNLCSRRQNIGHANSPLLSIVFSSRPLSENILTGCHNLFHPLHHLHTLFFCYASADMKPAPFRYAAARTLEQALELKAEYGDEARFLAGGQSLVPTMNFRLTQPAMLIDINPLTQLAGVQGGAPDSLRIGALTRYGILERDPATARNLPLVHEALPHIAHPQIRNRGTIGGNLAHADPASEMPAIVLALTGKLRAQSVRGERWIAALDFFTGALSTALEPDEMLTAVELPIAQPRSGACFIEVARRRGDFAIIGVACTVRLDEDGRCGEARIGLCNAGDRPIFAADACNSLVGRRIGAPDIDQAAALVQGAIDPGGNIHSSKEFQRHIAGVLTARALAIANERARRGH